MHSRALRRFLIHSALAAGALALAACSLAPTQRDSASSAAPAVSAVSPRAVKVMVVTLFAPEAQAWTKKLAFDQGVAVNQPDLAYGTELFQLNAALLQRALALSRTATLADTDPAKAYRKSYPQATAQAARRCCNATPSPATPTGTAIGWA
ncbi:MAG: hypothetical protein KGM91_03225, partial [Burkholderiales bacterium]|nr:hypothetical protein [Burkholderiales bacterium]